MHLTGNETIMQSETKKLNSEKENVWFELNLFIVKNTANSLWRNELKGHRGYMEINLISMEVCTKRLSNRPFIR